MAKFALPPLLAIALLVKLTQHRFRVHAECNLLYLHRFEQFSGFPLQSFRGELLSLSLGLFSLFLLLFWGFGGGCLGLELFNLFLCLASFFLCKGSLAHARREKE